MNISQLPLSDDGLEAIQAIREKACSVWVERVLAHARSDSHARDRERTLLEADILLRTRETQSQIGLTSHQRRHNLAGAAEVTGREVLLVHDVYTAGTRVGDGAPVFRRAGAVKAWAATVAGTLKPASKYEDIPESFKVSESQGCGDPGSVEEAEVDDFPTLKPRT